MIKIPHTTMKTAKIINKMMVVDVTNKTIGQRAPTIIKTTPTVWDPRELASPNDNPPFVSFDNHK